MATDVLARLPLGTRFAYHAYNLVSELATPVIAAYTMRRSGMRAVQHAFTLAPPARPSASLLLWVHGASVGETVSALPLVRTLLASDERASVLMTSGTAAALARLAMEDLGPRVLLQHRPADSASSMRRFLRWWRPDALILLESELWPNLLLQTHASGVPVALVNGRLSDRSLSRWSAIAPGTLSTLLACFKVTLARSPRMVRSLREAGSADATYRGDLKHLHAGSSPLAAERRDALCAAVGVGGRPRSSLWLAASTHVGEELPVLQAHAALRRSAHPNLLLILVPRHPERGMEVAAAASALGLPTALRSAGEVADESTAVCVCDTLGELRALYDLTDVAFVGGSLVDLGGHNLLEPAQADGGCAVLHGPHVEATAEAAEALGASRPPAARCVRDAAELEASVHALLSDSVERKASCHAAAATARTLEHGVLEGVWGELREPLGLPALPPLQLDERNVHSVEIY